MSVSNEVYAALVARNSELETKIGEAHAALRIAHDALFNDGGDGDVHDNAVRAIDAVLINTHNKSRTENTMKKPIKVALDALALAKQCGGELDLQQYAEAHAALDQVVQAAHAYDASLEAAEQPPTGADYEHIMSLLRLRTVDSVDDRETAIAAAIENAKQSDENVRRLAKILGLDETVQTSAVAIKADVADYTSVAALLDLHSGRVTLTDHSLGYPMLVTYDECVIWHAGKVYWVPRVAASGLPDGLDEDEIIEHIKQHGYWAVVDLSPILAGTSSGWSETIAALDNGSS